MNRSGPRASEGLGLLHFRGDSGHSCPSNLLVAILTNTCICTPGTIHIKTRLCASSRHSSEHPEVAFGTRGPNDTGEDSFDSNTYYLRGNASSLMQAGFAEEGVVGIQISRLLCGSGEV